MAACLCYSDCLFLKQLSFKKVSIPCILRKVRVRDQRFRWDGEQHLCRVCHGFVRPCVVKRAKTHLVNPANSFPVKFAAALVEQVGIGNRSELRSTAHLTKFVHQLKGGFAPRVSAATMNGLCFHQQHISIAEENVLACVGGVVLDDADAFVGGSTTERDVFGKNERFLCPIVNQNGGIVFVLLSNKEATTDT